MRHSHSALRSLRLLACFAVVSAIVLVARASHAIPAFARRYETSCQTCHVAFPRLTPFGEAFRRNGYRFPDGGDATAGNSYNASGGGGGGGAGGLILMRYSGTLTNNGTQTVTGGSGGTAGTSTSPTAGDHDDGDNGSAGANGTTDIKDYTDLFSSGTVYNNVFPFNVVDHQFSFRS